MLKMEENTQQFPHIMFYYFKKGKNATEMEKKVAQWEGAVTDGTCQKWFAKFPGTINILAKYSLLWGCRHRKMFSSPPGPYSLEASSGR